ncbi:MAG: DUF4386 domain-containing protein [Saprospiraceae bacterium]
MMIAQKTAARTFGIAFLIGYISYGFGFGLFNSFLNPSVDLAEIFNHKNQVIFQVAVMMAVFAPVNIVLGIIMTPIFKSYNASLAYGYLSSAIASTVLLVVGAIFLLLLVPLSEEFVKALPTDVSSFELFSLVCKKGNFYAYQIAMVIWGLGGFLFCYLLYMYKLVPQWLSIWGLIGYVIFVSGAFFALFGVNIDVLLDIPGGLFEIFLSFWLIVRGFNHVEFQTSTLKQV